MLSAFAMVCRSFRGKRRGSTRVCRPEVRSDEGSPDRTGRDIQGILRFDSPMGIRSIALLLALTLLQPLQVLAAEQAVDRLVVFVGPGGSQVDEAFRESVLPRVREIAAEMGVELLVKDASEGVPPEVGFTPALVFQNHRGRSIYQGRTTTPDRIRNFIRTSRFVPQGREPLVREKTFLWAMARVKVAAPLKITTLTGKTPPGHDHDAFVREAAGAMAKGFRRFRTVERVELGRSDRQFYMDLYPFLAEDDTLHVAAALFSQFDCKKPVFIRTDTPFTGPWAKRDEVFREAAAALEAAVQASLADPEGGDGFDPIPATTPQRSWEALGLKLPDPPVGRAPSPVVSTELPLHWVLDDSGPNDPPVVQFRFPAPLDAYVGEVESVRAEVRLAGKNSLDGAEGWVEADPASVTMGVDALDQAILGSGFLDVEKHGTARLVIEAVKGRDNTLAYGAITASAIEGRFTMKGVSIPLEVVGQIEPVIGEDGRPRLIVTGSFTIDLRTFTIPGADGPAPQRYTLRFDGHARLRPAPGK